MNILFNSLMVLIMACMVCYQTFATPASREQFDIGCSVFKRQSLASTNISDISIEPNKQKYQIASFDIGFNTSYTFDKKNPGFFKTDVISHYKNDFIIRALRFPGGTVGNFFDWETMSLRSQWKYFKEKRSVRNLAEQHMRMNKNKPLSASLRSFLDANKAISATPYIVLNVYTQDIQQTINSINLVKSLYSDPVKWELGNELSYEEYNKYSTKKSWNHDTYKMKSQKIINHININYPEDEIGIVTGDITTEKTLDDFKNLASVQNNSTAWNKSVATLKGYDAVIYHPYVKAFSEEKWLSFFSSQTTLINGCFNYLNYKWITSSSDKFPIAYSELSSKYFPGKAIWLTETGIVLQPGIRSKSFDQTGLRTLLLVNYYLSLFDMPTKPDSILYHILGSGSNNNVTKYLDQSLNSNGAALKIIQWVLHDSKYLQTLTFKNAIFERGVARNINHSYSTIKGLTSFNSNSHKNRSVFVNTSVTESYSIVNMKNIDNIMVSNFNTTESGSQLERLLSSRMESSQLENNRFTIPSMSIALVEYNK